VVAPDHYQFITSVDLTERAALGKSGMVPAMMRRAAFWALIAGAMTRAAAQVVWDPTAEFSTSNGNPNGVWSYGYTAVGFGALTAFTSHTTNSWYGPYSDSSPVIWLNTTTSTSYSVPPGYLSLHPGQATEPVILRWTAPSSYSGSTQIAGQFLAGDIGSMQLAIIHNRGTTDLGTLWSGTDAGSFNLHVDILAGDILNFAVFGGYSYGNTPLQMTITGVPEPSTYALLAIGACAMVVRRFRRRVTSV
jgi:hypothetical protein